MNWVFEHSQDADFALPLQLGGDKKKKGGNSGQPEPDTESISMLMAMGFTDQQARKALKKNVRKNKRKIFSLFLINLRYLSTISLYYPLMFHYNVCTCFLFIVGKTIFYSVNKWLFSCVNLILVLCLIVFRAIILKPLLSGCFRTPMKSTQWKLMRCQKRRTYQ